MEGGREGRKRDKERERRRGRYVSKEGLGDEPLSIFRQWERERESQTDRQGRGKSIWKSNCKGINSIENIKPSYCMLNYDKYSLKCEYV